MAQIHTGNKDVICVDGAYHGTNKTFTVFLWHFMTLHYVRNMTVWTCHLMNGTKITHNLNTSWSPPLLANIVENTREEKMNLNYTPKISKSRLKIEKLPALFVRVCSLVADRYNLFLLKCEEKK